MKISTEIASAAKLIGEESAIELYAKAGFDAWDFSLFEMCRYDWVTKKPIFTSHPLSGSNYLSFARKYNASKTGKKPNKKTALLNTIIFSPL